MDRKFPKITFDTFGFAFAHNCMISIRIDDYVFNGYLVRVRLVKGEKAISISVSISVDYRDMYENDEAFNSYLAMQINEAMKRLDESLREE